MITVPTWIANKMNLVTFHLINLISLSAQMLQVKLILSFVHFFLAGDIVDSFEGVLISVMCGWYILRMKQDEIVQEYSFDC